MHFQFIHIPKTGGTSVEHVLGKQELHSCALEAKQHCSAEFILRDSRETFCTVRDPYARVVSAANHRKAKNLNEWVSKHVGESKENKDKKDNNIVLPSSEFVFREDGTRVCDHVLKFETLKKDFCALTGAESCELPHAMVSTDKFSVKDLSSASIDLINNVYARDFENFGYAQKFE